MERYAVEVSGDYIGKMVKRFESGSLGSLALSGCGYDWGLSCGSYQLTLRWGNCIKFLKKYFPSIASELYFNSNMRDVSSKSFPGLEYCSSPEEVKEVWKNAYNSVGAENFFNVEHKYMEENFYEPFMRKICKEFNPNTYSRAMQECFWSWAIHKGVAGAYKHFKQVCEKMDINKCSEEELLDAIYDKRLEVDSFNRYKKNISAGNSERETLRKYVKTNPIPYKGTCSSISKPVENLVESVENTVIAYAKARVIVYIRSGCSTGSKKVSFVRVGVSLPVLEVLKNGWIKVRYKESEVGYCMYRNSRGKTYFNLTYVDKKGNSGDVVQFNGNVHYTSSYKNGVAKSCKPGKATIIKVAEGNAHPYNLKYVSGSGSTVNGWVDTKDIDF